MALRVLKFLKIVKKKDLNRQHAHFGEQNRQNNDKSSNLAAMSISQVMHKNLFHKLNLQSGLKYFDFKSIIYCCLLLPMPINRMKPFVNFFYL